MFFGHFVAGSELRNSWIKKKKKKRWDYYSLQNMPFFYLQNVFADHQDQLATAVIQINTKFDGR